MEPVGMYGPYPILTETVFQFSQLPFSLCPLAQVPLQSPAVNRKGMKALPPPKKVFSF